MVTSLVLAAVAAAAPVGQITSLDLSQYQLAGRFLLPTPLAEEASAVTYNWDTGTLFVLGDEGDALVQVSGNGTLINSMALTGFDDTEALTYIGGGQFIIGEERIQDVYRLTYAAGGSVARSALPVTSLGPTVGNVGIEGLSFDPLTGRVLAVKEKTPQRVADAFLDFNSADSALTDLFVPNLGVTDLSDIQVLTTVPSLLGTADQDNLLVYSQESRLLLEVTRAGVVLSSFSTAFLPDDIEGVTIDRNGVIYLVGETPELYVLTQIPAPGAAGLLGLAGLLAARRRR